MGKADIYRQAIALQNERDQLKAELEALRELYKKADRDATSSADQAMQLRKQLEEARGNFEESHTLFQELSKSLEREMTERDKLKAALEKTKMEVKRWNLRGIFAAARDELILYIEGLDYQSL